MNYSEYFNRIKNHLFNVIANKSSTLNNSLSIRNYVTRIKPNESDTGMLHNNKKLTKMKLNLIGPPQFMLNSKFTSSK